MPRLVVTPLSGLEDALDTYRPSHLVTLLSPQHMIGAPPSFTGQHLQLGLNDISDPKDGADPPARAHVVRLLEFSRDWDAKAPLLLHCWAGVSRSMAAAMTILCDRLGPGREIEIARAIRRRAPHANPNPLLVRHSDAILDRKGRMMDALNAMGPALPVTEGSCSIFPLINP